MGVKNIRDYPILHLDKTNCHNITEILLKVALNTIY